MSTLTYTNLQDMFVLVDIAFGASDPATRKALYKFISKLIYCRDLNNPNSLSFDYVNTNRNTIISQFHNTFNRRVSASTINSNLDILYGLLKPKLSPSTQTSTQKRTLRLKDLFPIIASKITKSRDRQIFYEFVRDLIQLRDRWNTYSDTLEAVFDNVTTLAILKSRLNLFYTSQQFDSYINQLKQLVAE